MSIQEIILGIVLVVCVVWTIRRTYLCFKRITGKSDPCEGCPCGCSGGAKTCPDEKK